MADESTCLIKLEAVRDIRGKTQALERVRGQLLKDVEKAENEERALAEFRQEMEELLQEKMAHVEELRQIHADINALETVIKQAEASRESAYKSARCLLEEYRPLKTEIDRRRQELLGLSRLPDLNENERHISIESLEKIACAGEMGWGMGGLGPVGGHLDQGPPPAAHQQAAILSMFRPRPPSPASTNNPPSAPAPSPFRQQPPPMKACLSCHQQIHRNAPICPLCKAKSRSRNPKKPKRKESSTPLPPSQ